MKKEEIQAIWNQFKSNEERNNHRENDILLAKNFGSKQQICVFVQTTHTLICNHAENDNVTYYRIEPIH
ncbi:MAG: hypothetical protein IM591_16350 [Chitinophagaceae bacterium]|uniref:hypothetical protein n=1 Tax=Microcystis sp. M061S2 TaxID=2771171 RepID=UPI0025847B8E|nr:hypothetical protein [Microcystis sp. M061S2]MCA2654876.1 hypothetical protein [Microcystis sp. M061S2]MCA6423844.1 hypothetical protein [Flavobacterium sp.]MCA6471944.1 hypothetical protein [Chitinophagaceae bacterium]